MKCTKCKRNISQTTKGVKCIKCSCNYHASCGKVNAELFESIKTGTAQWLCANCVIDASITQTSYIEFTDIVNDDNVSDMTNSLSDIASQFKSIQADHLKFSSSLKALNDKFDDILKLSKTIDQQSKRIKNLEQENAVFKNELEKIKSKLYSSDDIQRQCHTLLHGIPFQANENLNNLCTTIFDFFGVKAIINSVQSIERLKLKTSSATKSSVPPILLKLDSFYNKKKILDAVKAKKSISSRQLIIKDLSIEEFAGFKADSKFYFTDHLTTYKQHLLNKAKQLKDKKIAEFVWVQNNNILIKKFNDTSGKIVQITSEGQINDLLKASSE